MPESIEKKIEKIEPHLIGLWKFRQRGRKPVWCATFTFQGHYYDTQGKLTPHDALDKVHDELQKLWKKFGKETPAKKSSAKKPLKRGSGKKVKS